MPRVWKTVIGMTINCSGAMSGSPRLLHYFVRSSEYDGPVSERRTAEIFFIHEDRRSRSPHFRV
jgi:hypothetical protein